MVAVGEGAYFRWGMGLSEQMAVEPRLGGKARGGESSGGYKTPVPQHGTGLSC